MNGIGFLADRRADATAFRASEGALQDTSPNGAYTRAVLAVAAGDLAKAVELLLEASQSETDFLGATHPEHATTLVALSAVYARLQDYPGAFRLQKSARMIMIATHGSKKAAERTLPYIRSLFYSGDALVGARDWFRAQHYYASAAKKVRLSVDELKP